MWHYTQILKNTDTYIKTGMETHVTSVTGLADLSETPQSPELCPHLIQEKQKQKSRPVWSQG